MESVSKSGLQKVRTSTTVQPESISRKDVRIRYLLITDLLKIGRQIGTKVQSTKLSYLGCTFILFVVVLLLLVLVLLLLLATI